MRKKIYKRQEKKEEEEMGEVLIGTKTLKNIL